MIELKSVSKSFNNHQSMIHAIHKVDLKIRESEIFGLIGQSGAGKSTLLRFLNGLSHADEGKVLVEGQNVREMDAKQLRDFRKDIAMVFQRFNLLHNLSVRDNILLPLKLHHYIEHLPIEAVLEFVGLTEHQFQFPGQLSGGQLQRIGIARALITKPKMILLDEPTSALDEFTMNEIIDVLKRIHKTYGITMVVVTHQLSLVKRLCHRVGIMESGKLLNVLSVTNEEELTMPTSYAEFAQEVLKDA